jgi:hypothetical protein
MTVDEKNNYKILTGTLKKAFKEAKRKGTYSVKELFFLNAIFKTLSFAFQIVMSSKEQRQLIIFYHNILNSSEKFCIGEFESDYYKSIESNSGVLIENNKNNAPSVGDFLITDGSSGDVTTPVNKSRFNFKFNLKFN